MPSNRQYHSRYHSKNGLWELRMPSLDPEEQAQLLGKEEKCHFCKQTVRKNYCRQCDEFFTEGHRAECETMVPGGYSNNHSGHRTY